MFLVGICLNSLNLFTWNRFLINIPSSSKNDAESHNIASLFINIGKSNISISWVFLSIGHGELVTAGLELEIP